MKINHERTNERRVGALESWRRVAFLPSPSHPPTLPPRWWRRGSGLALLALLAAVFPASAKLNVIATTSDFGSVAREIGGDKVEVTVMARPTEDPHFVDARPSFIVKLNHADALIEGGAELEIGWLPALLENARNARLNSGAPGRIACNLGVPMLEVPTTLDRSKGDIHAAGNPHYMMDPANARLVAQHIADSFCKLDATSCEVFRANLQKFTAQLDAKMAEWQKRLAPFQGRRVVAYHNAWPYFSARFGVKVDLFLEPKPGLPPTPAHLVEVIAAMKEQKIHVIFAEPYLNRKTADKVAGDTAAVVLPVAQFPGGVKGVEADYLSLMDYLVTSLARALEEHK